MQYSATSPQPPPPLFTGRARPAPLVGLHKQPPTRGLGEANSTADVIAILKDPVKYPSPVRAIGSNHSTAPCGVVEGGTLIMMSKMNKIKQITADTVTAQGGAIYIDVAQELQKKNLQFYVNTEIGNLSIGSAACSGTKDGSMPGEFGQVGSYVTEVELVLPSGEIMEIDESQPELLRQVRSSYGLFGIVTAATFRVRRSEERR